MRPLSLIAAAFLAASALAGPVMTVRSGPARFPVSSHFAKGVPGLFSRLKMDSRQLRMFQGLNFQRKESWECLAPLAERLTSPEFSQALLRARGRGDAPFGNWAEEEQASVIGVLLSEKAGPFELALVERALAQANASVAKLVDEHLAATKRFETADPTAMTVEDFSFLGEKLRALDRIRTVLPMYLSEEREESLGTAYTVLAHKHRAARRSLVDRNLIRALVWEAAGGIENDAFSAAYGPAWQNAGLDRRLDDRQRKEVVEPLLADLSGSDPAKTLRALNELERISPAVSKGLLTDVIGGIVSFAEKTDVPADRERALTLVERLAANSEDAAVKKAAVERLLQVEFKGGRLAKEGPRFLEAVALIERSMPGVWGPLPAPTGGQLVRAGGLIVAQGGVIALIGTDWSAALGLGVALVGLWLMLMSSPRARAALGMAALHGVKLSAQPMGYLTASAGFVWFFLSLLARRGG